MASSNYVVRDIVQYIHDENDYGPQRSVSNVFARLKNNFWIFIIIIFFSGVVGYLAVYVPSAIETQQAKLEQSIEADGGIKGKLKGMSSEQKAQLLQEFGGAAAGGR